MMKPALTTLAIVLTCSLGLQACVPLIATGAAVGVSSTVDRRTYGAQLDDRTIEGRISKLVDQKLDEKVNVSATSFNRYVLLTGQALNESAKADVERFARETPNVRQVYNEITVGWPASTGTHANDVFITSKVKSRLFDPDNKGISGHHVKIVTESGVVYLMGIVSESEAKAAVDVARTTSSVQRVVNVFEVVSDEEIKRLNSQPAPAPVSNANGK